MVDRDINIGTDVATLLIFHPDDLVHRQHSPVGWYGYDFAYRRESAAGRLIGWSTGADGGYLVRVTTGGLRDEEEARALDSCDYPYAVRHGRVFVDNSDGLPGDAQMDTPDELPDRWVEIANGNYCVRVTAIDRSDDAAELADYVVTFKAVETLDGIEPEDAPPVLEPFAWDASEAAGEEIAKDEAPEAPAEPDTAAQHAARQRRRERHEAGFLWKAEPLAAESFGAFAVASEAVLVPGLSYDRPVSDEMAERLYPKGAGFDLPPGPVLATVLEPGRLALTSEVHGRSWLIGAGSRISTRATTLVRITAVQDDPEWPQVQVEPVAKPAMDADDAAAAAFRARLLAEVRPAEAQDAAGALTAPGFELERLETLFSAEAVTGWALQHLAMPLDRRLELLASPTSVRIAGIDALFSPAPAASA